MRRKIEVKDKNPFLKKNLKFLRDCFELTQQQIADALNVDRSTYTYWECGKIIPPIHKITAIIEFYRRNDVALDYNLLLDGAITASVMQEISK